MNSIIQKEALDFAALETAKVCSLNLVTETLSLSVGQVMRCYYIGNIDFTVPETGEVKPALLLATSEKLFVSLSFIINQTLRRFDFGSAFEIECVGEKPLQGGRRLKLYNIKQLEV